MQHDTAVFSVVLRGSAFADPAMDVRDMAPMLLGLAGALERANYLVYGAAARVKLSVRDIQPSSFEIVMQVWSAVSDTATVLVILGQAIRQLRQRGRGRRGRREEAKNIDRDAGWITPGQRVSGKDSAMGEMLAEDLIVRGHLEMLVQVLHKDGIDRISITRQGEVIVSLRKDDAEGFAIRDAEQSEFLGPQLERAFLLYCDAVDKSRLADLTKLEYKRQAGYFVRWIRGDYKPGMWK